MTTNIGDILTYTYVRLKAVEVIIGTLNIINVTMEEDIAFLSEVVIAAHGIKRVKKSLGYAVSNVIPVELERRTEGDVARVLSGKASGIEITTNNEKKSGQLTAGEINDSKNCDEWIKSLNHKDFNDLQEKWSFYLRHKINVKATSENNLPLANVGVNVFSINNKRLFTTRTDALGEASVFIDKSVFESEKYFIIQLVSNGSIVGKKITKSHDYVDFALDEAAKNNDAYIMFTIDATGSMGDEMDYLKAELENIFDRLDKSIKSKRLG
jgi:hypothetical protein